MFKMSVISDEVSQDIKVVASFARKFNLEGVEIRSVWNRSPQHLLPKADEIRRVLLEYDLKVSAIASPLFKADMDDEKEYAEHLSILRNCVDLAIKLDAKIIRGFTFWRKGKLEDFIDRIVERYQKPLEIIENEDLILGIENEPSTFAGNGRELSLFLSRINSNKVRAVWDPGNDIFDPLGEIPFPDGYRYVRGWIVHVHVKDGVRKGGDGRPEWTVFGEGEVSYKEQFKALREDNYMGYISLETHWRPKRRIPEESIIKPGGEEFSNSGEEASEKCMRNLIKILQSI
ncbi:MAG: sugar phosphate isomerase/epimerase family protein [Candidatus Bathyarchaeia archaeon]|nr:sugar phosphate isomerase/epimerase [Candidatus Bathyarchaeota archaeon]